MVPANQDAAKTEDEVVEDEAKLSPYKYIKIKTKNYRMFGE